MRIIPYRKVSDLDMRLKEFLGKDVHFVVPSRRDREWWKARIGLREFGLNEESETRLWNWEDLYNDLCEFFKLPRLRQIDPPDHRLILSHSVAGLLKEQHELLKLWPGLARPGFLDILSDDIRELINEDVSVEQLSVTVLNEKATSKVLPELYRRYLEYLSQNSLMDSAQIPIQARILLESASEDWAKDKAFVFVGFMSFTHGQLNLVRRLEELCQDVVVLKPATELKNFMDATQQLEGPIWEKEPPVVPGRIVSFCASEFALEPEAIARELALWHAGEGFLPVSANEPFPGFGAIGMMVPRPRAASVEAALRRYRIPYSPVRGRSIAQTLLGTVLSPLWVAWIQGLEAYETALLLAQPCLAGFDFSIDDAVLAGPRGIKGWEAYLAYKEKSVEKGADKKLYKRATKAFKALVKFCRTIEKGCSPVGLLAALHDFVTVPGLWLDALASFPLSNPDLDESLREMASSAAEVEAKRLALRELQPDLGAAGDTVLKGKEAIDFLRNWSEDTLIQTSPPIGGAVALYTGPPPILASHSVWIMTDVTQKNWPGIIRSSPLLDVEERELMSEVSAYLPSIHDKRTQKEALFRRLLQMGDSLTVTSCAATDQEGRPAGVTPFMESFIADMKLWERIEAPIASIANLMPRDGAHYFPAIEVGASEQTERGIPVVRTGRSNDNQAEEPEKYRLPVSELQGLLDCPLRYWLRRCAKLKERNLSLLNSAEAGQLTHKIWETVWRRRAETNAPLTRLTAEEWKRALSLDDCYIPFRHLLSDRRLVRHLKNMEFHVLRLARRQQDILDRLTRSDLTHTRLYLEEEMTLTYELDDVVFTGRCDRVELLNDRHIVITDYKLGKSASYEKQLSRLNSRRYLSTEYAVFRHGLQLSAYALMYGAQYPHHRISGVGYLGHKDGTLTGTFESPLVECYLPDKKSGSSAKEGIMAERMEEAQEAMRCAAAILKSRRYEPCYIADSCRYCDMKGVCRKGELRGEALRGIEENEGDAEGYDEKYEKLAD